MGPIPNNKQHSYFRRKVYVPTTPLHHHQNHLFAEV